MLGTQKIESSAHPLNVQMPNGLFERTKTTPNRSLLLWLNFLDGGKKFKRRRRGFEEVYYLFLVKKIKIGCLTKYTTDCLVPKP